MPNKTYASTVPPVCGMLTGLRRCGSVIGMTEALYQDAGLTFDEHGIAGVKAAPMGWLSGYWFPVDFQRRSKQTLVILDAGARVPVS